MDQDQDHNHDMTKIDPNSPLGVQATSTSRLTASESWCPSIDVSWRGVAAQLLGMPCTGFGWFGRFGRFGGLAACAAWRLAS